MSEPKDEIELRRVELQLEQAESVAERCDARPSWDQRGGLVASWIGVAMRRGRSMPSSN